MKTSARIDRQQIDDMDLDITIRMKVSEWREVMRDSGPAPGLLRHYISSVLGHLTRATEMTFVEPKHEDTD